MGGGAAGTVSLPTYMAVYHAWMMDADRSTTNKATGHNWSATAGVGSMNVYDDTYAARGGPYDEADAYDPTDALKDMLTEVQEFETAISALSPETDFQTYMDRVKLNLAEMVAEEELAGMSLDTIPVAAQSSVSAITVTAKPTVSAITVPDPGTVAAITVSQINVPTFSVDALVSAFEVRHRKVVDRGTASLMAGLSDINAVVSSSFVFGVASRENDFAWQVAEFDAKVTVSAAEKEFDGELQGELAYLRALLERDMQEREVQARLDLQDQQLETQTDIEELRGTVQYELQNQQVNAQTDMAELEATTRKDMQTQMLTLEADKVEFVSTADMRRLLPQLRVQAYTQGINMMAAMLGSKMGLMDSETSKQLQYGQSRIIAETDETNRNLEIDHLDFTWNLSLYDYSARWMGAASGSAVPVSGKPSSVQSALGGAMTGAQMGGKMGGPIGAGIGAIAGGIGGLL